MQVGFIGLGNMGARMADNLARAGMAVVGYDPVAPCPTGIKAGLSAADAAAGAAVVVTMLPDGKTLIDVAKTILPHMNDGAILLDCSTCDLESTRWASTLLQGKGLEFVDAPVSGGITGAREGTLTFMAGGAPEAFGRVMELLEIMGSRMVHCGPVGSGQMAKMCNNMILGATMIATCESFALAEKLGLDPGILHEVVSTSSGSSWVSNAYTPLPGVGRHSPADNDYAAGFRADLMLKDLRLAVGAAAHAGAMIPMGELAERYYEEFVTEDGEGARDFSAVYLKLAGRL